MITIYWKVNDVHLVNAFCNPTGLIICSSVTVWWDDDFDVGMPLNKFEVVMKEVEALVRLNVTHNIII